MSENSNKKTEEEFEYVIKDIEKHVKKCDKYYDFTNWYAGITDGAEEIKKEFEKKTKVEYFEKWNLQTKQNARSFIDYLHKEMEFQSIIEGKISKYKNNSIIFKLYDDTIDETINENSKFVFIFKNK